MAHARQPTFEGFVSGAEINNTPMSYLLAILLPPLAVLRYGTAAQCFLNVNLTAYFWLPGVYHAVSVVRTQRQRGGLASLVTALRYLIEDRDRLQAA